jgi:hypothetical protein
VDLGRLSLGEDVMDAHPGSRLPAPGAEVTGARARRISAGLSIEPTLVRRSW